MSPQDGDFVTKKVGEFGRTSFDDLWKYRLFGESGELKVGQLDAIP